MPKPRMGRCAACHRPDVPMDARIPDTCMACAMRKRIGDIPSDDCDYLSVGGGEAPTPASGSGPTPAAEQRVQSGRCIVCGTRFEFIRRPGAAPTTCALHTGTRGARAARTRRSRKAAQRKTDSDAPTAGAPGDSR